MKKPSKKQIGILRFIANQGVVAQHPMWSWVWYIARDRARSEVVTKSVQVLMSRKLVDKVRIDNYDCRLVLTDAGRQALEGTAS